jgi:hypothetical protein
MAAATGDHLAFLDADNRWTENKLALQLASLAGGDLDIVFGGVVQVRDVDWAPALAAGELRPGPIMPGYTVCTALLRRSTFERVGPFDSRWRAGEFIDWYLRAIELGVRVGEVPEIVVWRRLHDANHGIVQRAAYAPDYLRIVRAGLDRRRAHESSGQG